MAVQPIQSNCVNLSSKQNKEYSMNENSYNRYNDSPGLVKTIAVLTLINGIINIFWGLILTGTIVIPTFGLALLCLPLVLFTLLPTILGIFETLYSIKLLSDPPQPVQPSTTIAMLEILCVLTGNVFSMIVGILSLVFYNDPQVKEYFAHINRMPYPVAPKAPVPPTPPAAQNPVSSQKETPVIEAEVPAKETPKAPAAPTPKKPRSRKVATEKTGTASKGEAASKSEKPKRKPKSGNSSS